MSEQDPRRSRRRLWLLPLLLVPLVPIVVAVLLSSGGGTGATASTFTPVGASAAATVPAHNAARRHKPGAAGASSKSSHPPAQAVHGTAVAVLTRATPMRSAPGGHVFATLTTHTNFGSVTAVPVVRRKGPWLGVISLLAGNGRLGWIRASAATLTRVDWRIHVDLAARVLMVVHDGKLIKRYRIAIGAPDAPTPTGHFAVTDRLNTGVEIGPYSCCILALSALAPHHISDWDGGNRIAIHATNYTTTIGEPVSHGCMHVTPAEGRWLLAHVPDGTPVVISSA